MLEDDKAYMAGCKCPFKLHCHASVPLAVGERRLGMLNVAAPDLRVLTEDELNLLTTVGALVSLVIERSRLEAESARAIAAEERNRIARDIHDTLAQGLAALTMQLETVDALAATHGIDSIGNAVARSLQLARNTLDEARCSVLDLRASPLDGRALPQALRELVAETRDNAASDTEMLVDIRGFGGGVPDLPVAIEVGVYRIAQQAVANILLHANARRVNIRLERNESRVRLRIEDDGDGFEPAAVPPNRFGLVGMGDRAKLLGGRMTIETSSDVGTAVDVEIPLRTVNRFQRSGT
jgi:two-component system NarL family sensor kinase